MPETPTYIVTYDVVTPESAAAGDFADNGFDVEREPLEPDQYDRDDAADLDRDPIVHLAAELLNKYYATEPSDSRPTGRCWYSQPDPTTDYRTGEERRQSVHFEGLTDDQWLALHAIMAAANK